MIFGKNMLLNAVTGGDHRNDVIVTSRDTDQKQKQANNGDKRYMLL